MTPSSRLLTTLLAFPLFLAAQEDRAASEERAIEEAVIQEWNRNEQEEIAQAEDLSFDSHYLPPTYLPPTYYYTQAVAYDGSSLELNDGSVWSVDNWNRNAVLNFDSSDPLFLTPNTGWWSKGGYLLVNETRGVRIPVVYTQPPLLNTPYSYQIADLDYANRIISLTNGQTIFRWEIKNSDFPLFARFKVGDYVLLGRMTGFQSWKNHPHTDLIINIAMQGLPHIRVHQL